MKRVKICIAVLSIASLLSCSAQPDMAVNKTIQELSSKKYAGRLVGTAGNEKAAEYIAAYFKDNGLEPLLDTGYFQEYPQKAADPAAQQPEVTVTNRDGSKRTLLYGEEYILNAVAEDMSLTMPLSFDSTGEYADGVIPVIPSEKRASQPKGCKVLMVAYDEFRFAPAIPQPGDCLYICITTAVMNEMKKNSAASAEIKCKSVVHAYQARNVVAAIKGKDGAKAVVLTAHFDHAGSQGSQVFPGALDNASGVAALLSAAARIKEALGNNKPETDILFACVNSEECSGPQQIFAGSEALVQALSKQYAELFNINIDCVGGKGLGPLAMGATSDNLAGLYKELKGTLQENSVDCSDIKYETAGDHEPFIYMGYGAMVVAQNDTIRNIHNETDTAGKIDVTEVSNIAKGLAEFTLSFDFSEFKKAAPDETDEYFDSIQWWKDAYSERDKVLQGKSLKYNEGINFMFDDTLLTATGRRPLTSLEELNQYYPDVILPKTVLSFAFDNADIDNFALPYMTRSEKGLKIDNEMPSKVSEIPLNINDVSTVKIEYIREGSQYLGIEISIFDKNQKGSGVVQEPLEQAYEGYSINQMEGGEEGRYHSFTYREGKWYIEVSTYQKKEFKDIYAEDKRIMVPDYSTQLKTKQQMVELIDSLDIKGRAKELISDIGLQQ